MNNTVSVLISAYNRPQFVGEAIQSILDSDYKDLQILVRNSSDEAYRAEVTAEILKYPVTLFHGINKNASHSFNALAARATGQYLFGMSDDDVVTPSLIGRLVELLQGCELACAQPEFIDEQGRPITDHAWTRHRKIVNMPRDQMRDLMYLGTPFVGGSLIRKALFIELGGGDEQLYNLPDLAIYLGVLEIGMIKVIEEPLYKMRIHASNTSHIYPEQKTRFESEINQIRRRFFRKQVANLPSALSQCT
jgi:glycosyltransferase involved in cell wall biosynthesis